MRCVDTDKKGEIFWRNCYSCFLYVSYVYSSHLEEKTERERQTERETDRERKREREKKKKKKKKKS